MPMDGVSHPIATASRPLHPPIICFSPVRWRGAHRLQRLMSRFARQREVFFLEEPVGSDAESLQIRPCGLTGVQIVTPMLPSPDIKARRAALDLLLARSGSAVAWYTAPEARAFSHHAPWLARVYDCAGEGSATGCDLEDRLIQEADLVFTGRFGPYEDRRDRHPNIHCFSDGIDLDHLGAARRLLPEPDDQIGLRRPLLGRFGPVDDRLDLNFLTRIATLRPHWQFAMIGEIQTARDLPRADNIHWLGARDESELPPYLSHWDLAIMPLVRGTVPDAAEAPRYLAGGRRVVSTPVREIAMRFAGMAAVATAGTPEEFVSVAEEAMLRADVSDFVAVDDFLLTVSWEATQRQMAALLNTAERNAAVPAHSMSRFGSPPAFVAS
jgi:UDP-galactopyranose mutase